MPLMPVSFETFQIINVWEWPIQNKKKKHKFINIWWSFKNLEKYVTHYILESLINDRSILQRLKMMVYIFIVISITMYERFSQSHLK